MPTSNRRRGTGSGRSCEVRGLTCYVCHQPSVGQCQSCWKFYCPDHGDVLCRACREQAPRWDHSPGTGGFVEFGAGAGGHPDEPPPDIDAMLQEAGIPRRRVLLRVVPAVQTQTVGETQVGVVSLELYDDAFVANVQLRRLEERRPDNPFLAMPGMPHFVFEASDDTGQTYTGSQSSGGGDGAEWKFEAVFTPALPEDATSLTLIVKELRWLAMGAGGRSRLEPGPWRFEIPLT
jgi:hypothetical protein